MNLRKWSWRRRLLTGVGTLVGLVLIAAIAVPFLVPAEKWKALAFEQLEKNTQLVGSAQSASVSLIPLGLQLGGLHVEDPQGITQVEDFRFDLDKVIVRASLGSILRGAPEVAEVRLVKPRLELRLPAATASTEAPRAGDGAGQPGETADLAFVLALLSIEDGSLIVHDPAGTRIELTGLENRASLRTATGILDGELKGELDRMVVSSDSLPTPFTLPPSSWELTVQAQLDGSGGAIKVERIEIAGAQSTGTVAWTMTPQREPEFDVDLEVRSDLARLWTEFLRGQVTAQPLPAPWTADDFAITAGEAVLDLGLQGVLPASDPEDPSAVLRPLRIAGTVTGVKMRVLDRNDLASLDSKLSVQNAVLRFEEARMTGALGTVEATFGVALSLAEPLRGRASADLDLAALRSLGEQWWPRFAEQAGEEAAGPQEWPTLSGRVQAEAQFAIAADGSFDPLTASADAVTWIARTDLLTTRLPTMTEDVRIRSAQLVGDLKHANLETAQVEGPGVVGEAVLQLSGWPEATIVRGSVTAASLDLDALQAAMIPTEETASLNPRALDRLFGVRVAQAQADDAGLPPPPAELDVDVHVRAQQVMSAGYTLREVQGHATLVQQKLEVQDIAGKLGTGSIEGDAAVDWTADPPDWESDLRATDVPASALLEPVAGSLASALTTNFSGVVELDGPLALEPEQILTALTGAIAMRSSQGSFAAESLLGPTVSKFLGGAAQKWRSIDFSALTADVSVSDGRVHFDKVFLTGETELQATGSVGLDGTPAYRLDVRLPRGITPELGALAPVGDLLRDSDGRINFGVDVSGTAKQPKVEIDFADLQRRAQNAGEDRLRNELRDRLGGGDAKDELDKALGGKLDQLLGGTKPGATASDSVATDSTAVDPRKALEDQAKDAAGSLLDRLKGKKKGGGNDD